ncbi:MAG TPA: hypothetical protein VFK86_12475 [Bauldia sp.]|nr:hypothetical protein [Bauldia sp.]
MPIIDFIGTIVLITVTMVSVNSVISTMPIPRIARLGAAVGIGLWIGLQVALTSAGVYAQPVPYIGIAVVLPVVAAALAVRVSPQFRAALLAVPTPLLVGLNISRVFGLFFLILAADGRLGGPFPQSAGWGDFATGALAIPLLFAMVRGRAGAGAIQAWNAFGALDLFVAVSLGVLSAPGAPLQVIDVGGDSSAVTSLPWALIPTVLVPFFLISHGTIFLQMRKPASQRLRPA